MNAILYDGPDSVRVVQTEPATPPDEKITVDGVVYRPFSGIAWNLREEWRHDHFLYINDALSEKDEDVIRTGNP